jgi:hypothetical protein
MIGTVRLQALLYVGINLAEKTYRTKQEEGQTETCDYIVAARKLGTRD